VIHSALQTRFRDLHLETKQGKGYDCASLRKEAEMKFVGISSLRGHTALSPRELAEEAVALTAHGKPFALVVGLKENEDPSELERLIVQARAQRTVARIRARARAGGLDRLEPDEIEAEIRAVRAERPR
jgi:antitoxin (DNA-binding transcriptional repressor) of toxin-antitoxin stability system